MPIFGGKKKLKKQLEEAENQLAVTRRKQEADRHRQHQEQQLKEQERARERIDEQLRQQSYERAIAETRLREEERLGREAKKKEQEQKKLKLEQQEHEERQRRLAEASPETLRELRELIRKRYELDCEIWRLRNARKPDHPFVEKKMEQSDDVLKRILEMLKAWGDNSDKGWTDEEWTKVTEIRRRLTSDGKRVWKNNPPWGERR